MSHFNVRKAAQVVAFFIAKRGGKTGIVDAMKLAYLADRESLRLYDRLIIEDDFYVMKYGPVDSATYDFAKGARKDSNVWDQYVTKKGDNLHLVDGADDSLDQLNEKETKILESVYSQFENIKEFDLVEWVHKNCKEWSHPGDTSWYLPYQDVLRHLGKKNIDGIANKIHERRKLKMEMAKAAE